MISIIAIALLAIVPAAFAQAPPSARDRQPEIAIERYGLPASVVAEGELLSDLATRTGIAGSQLEGIRLRIALPTDFEVESVRLQLVDGVFLVHENSFLGAVGGFLMRLARLLLFGQLVDVGGGLQIPSGLWFVLLDGDPTKEEPVRVKAEQKLSIDRDDKRMTQHGDFIVCRLIAATTPFSEIIGLEIRGERPTNGEQIRYFMPRLVVPPIVSALDAGELASQSALATWLGAAP